MTARQTVITAVETASRFVGEALIAWADSLIEMRCEFSNPESGDYLTGRMESDGPDAADALKFGGMRVVTDEERRRADPFRCVEHNVDLAKCARMPHAEGDEWNNEPVCYFCDRPTDRVVTTSDDGDTKRVCAACATVGSSPAAVPPRAAAADPAAEVSDGLIPPMAPPIPAGSPTSPGTPFWDFIDAVSRQMAVLYRDIGMHNIADLLDPPK